MEYLEKVDPHLIMVAFPCGPSSVMQNTVARKNVLAFKAAVLENPAGAKSWDTEEISEATLPVLTNVDLAYDIRLTKYRCERRSPAKRR